MVTQAQAKENMEKGLVYTGYPYVKPGTKAFMVLRVRRQADIIVGCVVEETEDIYDAGLNKSVWHYQDINGLDRVSIPTDEVDENGWNKYRHLTFDEFSKEFPSAKRVNQFLTMDEPIGHSVQLGDDVFLSLNEALACAKPSKKKHLYRRLKNYRRSVTGFIASTWRRNGENHPGFPKYPDKKIYVRKK